MRPAIAKPRLAETIPRPRLPRLGNLPALRAALPPLALLATMAVLLWLGLRPLGTPDVVPADAPATEFSAARAMEHLRVIAAEPRVIGSPGNIAARQYLIDQIRALGLEPEVQTTTSVVSEGREGFRAGVVNNVIVRVPGTASTGVIAINAHYDSGDTGPGASDCGSCVVTGLETLRATLASEPLKNDLLFVFVDGEERHMMGSAAFTEQHPWAKDIRLALNYEATGSGGAAILYVTSEDNAWLVSEFLDVAPDPAAWSLIPTISNLFPDGRFDSDLGEYTQQGSQGLGFLYFDDPTAYHSARDNIAEIDLGSIQQEGGYTLAVARYFGNLDLTDMPSSGDRVFFNVWPGVVVHYSATWAVPLAALVTLAIAGLLVLGRRRSELTTGGLLAGALGWLLITLGATLASVLLWVVVRLVEADYQVWMVGSYQTTLHVVALCAATVAAVMALYTLLGRRVRQQNLVAGTLLASLVPLWVTSLLAPGLSYLVAWPLLFASLPLAWRLLVRERAMSDWIRVAVLAVAAIPALVLLPATLAQMTALAVRFEGMLGMPILGLTMLFVAPIVALLLPHLHILGGASESRRLRWAVPGTATLVAVALFGWGIATSGFDAKHPRPDSIAYEMNADTGQAQWVSFDTSLDDWTGEFFPAGTKKVDHEWLATGSRPAFTAPAPAVSLAAPEITVLDDTTTGDIRTLRLRLTSPRGTSEMATAVDVPGEIVSATVNGHEVDLGDYAPAREGELTLIYANVTDGGWELTVAVRSTDPLTVRLEEITRGLPEAPSMDVPPRPADTMPSPVFPRDPTIVMRTFTF
ncbi:MAG TPA: M28 family peptidase [Thermomicrobiales bacterium]|nr:M28 family peptidase [Thermomicrobiales bacterium]